MIAIGCDHGGYQLKEEIVRYLKEKEIEVKDFGTYSEERAEYPMIAKAVTESVVNKECEYGILICRSGLGMSIVANKYKGIRCVPFYNEETAKYSKMHNNANMLALGADYVTVNEAIKIVRMWLATEFEGGRHQARVDMISEIENNNMK